MKRHTPYLTLAAIAFSGLLLAAVFSAAIDYAAFRGNQTLDGEPGFSEGEYERYNIQAVEAHIVGTGWAIILTMALMVVWMERWRFPAKERS